MQQPFWRLLEGLVIPSPVPRFSVGLQSANRKRMQTAKQIEKAAWVEIVSFAIRKEPRTFQQYATHLNSIGLQTSRGGRWDPKAVQRVFIANGLSKTNGLTPTKRLLDRVTRPSALTRRYDWPRQVYLAYQEARRILDEPTAGNGSWRSATNAAVTRFDTVEHKDHGVGSVVEVQGLARYRCSFLRLRPLETFEVDCVAADLRVFVWRRSRAERLALTGAAQARFFRTDNRIPVHQTPKTR